MGQPLDLFSVDRSSLQPSRSEGDHLWLRGVNRSERTHGLHG